MRLLALDTATELCSAAMWIDGEVRTREAIAPRAHGRLLLPMVEELLAESGLKLAGLDAIAFGRGPGAFTGVRLAAAVAQGLGFASGRPLIGISDLRALAAAALCGAAAARVLVCQDARMEEVYWGCFEASGTPATPRLLGAEHVSSPLAVQLPPTWAGGSEANLCATGSGWQVYPALRERWSAAVAHWRPALRPRAQDIARLAAADGLDCAVAPEQGLPVYLRDQVTASP
jgi:tRNA threonylcarbamoyladenosine biosynthesis protein TsaB